MTSPASFHAKSAREVSSVGVVSSQIAASVGTYDVDTRTAGKAQAPPDSRQPAYGFVPRSLMIATAFSRSTLALVAAFRSFVRGNVPG